MLAQFDSRFFDVDSLEIDDLEKESQNIIESKRRCFPRIFSGFLFKIREVWKRRKNFCLGVATLGLVVLTVATIISSLSHLSVVYFLIAEHEEGQTDMIVRSYSSMSSINYTRMETRLREIDESTFFFNSPRNIFTDTNVRSYDTCYEIFDNINSSEYTTSLYRILDLNNMKNCKERKVDLLIFDFDRENDMGLGRNWKYSKLENGEDVGDTILLSLRDEEFFFAVYSSIEESMEKPVMISGEEHTELEDDKFYILRYQPRIKFNESTNSISDLYEPFPWRISFPMKVKEVVDDFSGKVNGGSMPLELVMMEYKFFFRRISEYLHPELQEPYAEKLFSEISPYHYASEVHVNHPERFELYSSSSTSIEKAETELKRFGASFNYFLGFPQLHQEYPLLVYLSSMDMVSMILSLIIYVIIFIVSIISSSLLYMLFKFNFEERQGDFAMLRMLGVSKKGIHKLIWMEVFLHVIPGIVLGLIGSYGLFALITLLLKAYFGSQMVPHLRYTLTVESVLVSILIGVLVPFISSIHPIRTLRNNGISEVNNPRAKSSSGNNNQTNHECKSNSQKSISSPELVVGLFGGLFGLFMYYVLPMSLISMNVPLLLSIFLGLLLLMMFGLILIFLNVVVFFEWILMGIFIQRWESSAVVKLVKKFLISHRKKNVKVTLVFSVSVACVIFIAVSFELNKEMNSFKHLKQFGGPGLVITHGGIWNDNEDSKRDKIENLYRMKNDFETLMADLDIESYTCITFPLSQILFDFNELNLQNLGGTIQVECDLSAISPNFYEVLDDTYLKIGSSWGNDHRSVSEQLYTVRGSHSVLLDSNLKYKIGLKKLTDNLILKVGDGKGEADRFLIRPNSFVNSAAIASFTKFRDDSQISDAVGLRMSHGRGEDVFCSFPFYMKVLDRFRHEGGSFGKYDFSSMDEIPIKKIFVRNLKDKKTFEVVQRNVSQMLLEYDLQESSIEHIEESEQLNMITGSMDLILYFSTGILLLLSFFSLSSEMWSNIREQKKEIGVLLAMGLSKRRIFRLFLEETFVLVISALCFGLVIGVVIGYTLVAQQSQFSQLPVSFVFPWKIFLVTFAGGALISFLSTSLIMCCYLRREIVTFLR